MNFEEKYEKYIKENVYDSQAPKPSKADNFRVNEEIKKKIAELSILITDELTLVKENEEYSLLKELRENLNDTYCDYNIGNLSESKAFWKEQNMK